MTPIRVVKTTSILLTLYAFFTNEGRQEGQISLPVYGRQLYQFLCEHMQQNLAFDICLLFKKDIHEASQDRACLLLNSNGIFSLDLPEEKPVQKTENLAIGACSQYDAEFCSRQVENSVCNQVKNECFCRKGFVAIRENGRVTCKTLLTDLKCRVDRDCVHVNRSSCHPGAGYCSCPGNTIYVPERHACRSRFVYPNDPICDACIHLNGMCYKYEPFDRVTADQRVNPNGVGCVCPDHRVSISTRTSDPFKYMCDGKLVDIGSECDDESLFCRSMNSICKPVQEELSLTLAELHGTKSNLWSENFSVGDRSRKSQIIRTCQCKPGSIPVYQTNLKYNECFKILPMKAKKCQKCVDTGGQCYDLNDDGTGDGCDCPPSFSPTVYGKDNSETYCGMAHVSVNCTNGYFSICYYPHVYGPYNSLFDDLMDHRSMVRLASGNYLTQTFILPTEGGISSDNDNNNSHHYSDFARQCALKLENGTAITESIDVWRLNGICGIRVYKLNHDTVQYEGILEVLVNNSLRNPSRDKVIPLKCISRIPNRPMISASRTPQTIATMNPSATLTRPQISLRILNEKNKEILSAFAGSRIRLDALLLNPSGMYKKISAEYCYGNNRSIHSEYSKSEKGTLLIDQRCANKNALLNAKFSNTGLSNDHLQTGMFPAFRLGNMTLVFFTCVFRICQLTTDCDQAKCKPDNGVQKVTTRDMREEDKIMSYFDPNTKINSGTSEANQMYKGDGYFFRVKADAHIEVTEKRYKKTENTKNSEMNSNYPIPNHQSDFQSTSSLASTHDRPLCNYALCLTTIHLTWILFSLFVLLTLFCITLLLIYRKYRLFINKKTFDKLCKQQHNLPTMQPSSVLAKSCYSEHSSPSRFYTKEYYQPNYILNPELTLNSTIMSPDNLDLKSSFQLNTLTHPSVSSSTSPQSSSSLLLTSTVLTTGSFNPLDSKNNFFDPTPSTISNMTLVLKNPNLLKQENLPWDSTDLFCRKSSPIKLNESNALMVTPGIQTTAAHSCYCHSLNLWHRPHLQHHYANDDCLKTTPSDDCLIHSSHILRDDLLKKPNYIGEQTKQHLQETDMIDLFPSTTVSHNLSNNTFLCIQNIQSKALGGGSKEGKNTRSIIPAVTCSISTVHAAPQFYTFHKTQSVCKSFDATSRSSELTTLKRRHRLPENYFKNDSPSGTYLSPEQHHQIHCSGAMVISNNKPQTSMNDAFSL
ncbi:unnamed protein product [Heterobilharzia americana]|nr:unnamed protein product [Heterobilharzia americana]